VAIEIEKGKIKRSSVKKRRTPVRASGRKIASKQKADKSSKKVSGSKRKSTRGRSSGKKLGRKSAKK